MATGKGLDSAFVNTIDWPLALKRISQDVRTDFIHAPHVSVIYRQAGDSLVEQVTRELNGGTYRSGEPVTFEVPKTYRMAVADGRKRGPQLLASRKHPDRPPNVSVDSSGAQRSAMATAFRRRWRRRTRGPRGTVRGCRGALFEFAPLGFVAACV